MQLLKKSAKTSMAQLKLWSKEEFGERKRKLELLMKELQMIRQSKKPYECGAEIKKLEKQIDNILIDEKIYWK